MAIQEILNTTGAVDPVKGGNRPTTSAKSSTVRAKEKSDSDERSDRIELSDEARAMYESQQSGRFEAIRERIRQGFYFQKDVTEKVVDAMLKDIKSGPSET
jgi:anti-sigma28 factor (negative regulator of flagellin synthesis)